MVNGGVTILSASFSGMAATNYYVATNGPGGAFTNWATAASNIQDAIDRTSAGDMVWVSNGVYNAGGVTNSYAGNVLTNRIFISKAISIWSVNNDPTNTVIMGAKDPGTPAGTNGPAAVRCVYLVDGAALVGFTLTNGATLASGGGTYDLYGGGICAKNSTNSIISNCVIAGNSADSAGGMFWGTLYNCRIAGNSASYAGGGVRNGKLHNCTLIDNFAQSYGGGAAAMGGFCILVNCTIAGNSTAKAGSGGGVYFCVVSNCTLINNWGPLGNGGAQGGGAYDGSLYNCTFIGNSAEFGGGAYYGTLYNCLLVSNAASFYFGGGAFGSALYNCTVINNSTPNNGGGVNGGNCYNCIVYNNSPNNWYDTTSIFTNSCTYPTQSTWTASMGNITNNPMFMDTNESNYRLSQNSPCINAGLNQSWMATNNIDLDGHGRIDKFSGMVDMGCYEYLPAGTWYGFR
jgi:hypothetical protein